ncbi:ATP synthase F1 subunit delta [Candidatus Nucleicultrix amoebiphila]|jgi:F-type H+-transporting ATPase subunit delta|uniref:ATP synthase subunit delta n=1 Tax=Candidatus Nucleicultrix amoebiphila FS5 TaxID=1414854 RepID=A0A1W6N3U6_9PROT|nr:ATP synthase F1 subunit delta [Candidatus Nucleicultrix amoebiphila]ARN84449.1 hypothetical protein GQ61_02935 [Candidatus Nucleicultrix amoebiphila FS5]
MSRAVKVYGKALFDYANELNALDEVSKDFESLRQLISESPDFQNFLSNPTFSKKNSIEVLKSIAESAQFTEVLLKLFILLAEQRRLNLLSDIIEEFHALYQSKKGYLMAQVTSSSPLQDKQVNSLQLILKEITGKQVLLKHQENPELLGGFVVSLNSLQADFSIKAQLNNLRSELEG